ncbi:MAG: LLM class flavin-dependent oxidoreductase [Candidatus Bathyarchaeia archaeon]|nr:LLM class flavin-dependent oxidoreductase [Candidatus Bathyarchaeota archaeon]
MSGVRFGINPTPHPWPDVKRFAEWCVRVEDLGYDGIFLPDHYDLPAPSFPSNELLDAWTTLSYISAKTSSVRVGCMVSPIPRWIPSQLAKIIATVDFLSEGRVIAGFGVGFYPPEFINYSPTASFDDDRTRIEKFEEGIQVILKLWTEDNVNFNGKYYRLSNATLLPKPKQKPHPPMWSGGMGPRSLKITAKYFDGWIAHRAPSPHRVVSLEDYESRVKMVRDLLRGYGRDPTKFTFVFLLMIGLDLKDLGESVKFIEDHARAGCQYFIVEFTPPPPPQKYMELSERFAREVIPSFT